MELALGFTVADNNASDVCEREKFGSGSSNVLNRFLTKKVTRKVTPKAKGPRSVSWQGRNRILCITCLNYGHKIFAKSKLCLYLYLCDFTPCPTRF